MSKCGVCQKDHSPFVMNHKRVCLRCDDLLFDIEIESDEEPARPVPRAQRMGEVIEIRPYPTTN